MKLVNKQGTKGAMSGCGAEGQINGQPIEWLPSIPLTKKHKVPSISGYGILYSEELERTLHIFQTRDLAKDLNEQWREQALALGTDPNCRLYWLETSGAASNGIEAAAPSVSYG